MGEIITTSQPLTLEEISAAIAFSQPKLHATQDGADFRIAGSYILSKNSTGADPEGPISEFDVEIVLSSRYPDKRPKVFEVSKRIPRTSDRHINPDGDCCITVWEHWLASTRDHSFLSFLNGPLRQFFLSQYLFERSNKWPFGEYPHGKDGLQEAYAETLGIPNKIQNILYHLRLLSHEWPKGHWICPCGSGQRLRRCHRDDMMLLHRRIPSRLARQMLSKLKTSL